MKGHVRVETVMHVTMEELWEAVFSVDPCRGYIWRIWQGPAAYIKDRRVLSSERAPHKNKTVTVTQVIKIWS
jgi:hypothetical protein